MTKTKRKKKKSPQDLTNRNAKSYNRRFSNIDVEMTMLCLHNIKNERYCRTLLDLLKSKRLLTPAQVKMLEECLR